MPFLGGKREVTVGTKGDYDLKLGKRSEFELIVTLEMPKATWHKYFLKIKRAFPKIKRFRLEDAEVMHPPSEVRQVMEGRFLKSEVIKDVLKMEHLKDAPIGKTGLTTKTLAFSGISVKDVKITIPDRGKTNEAEVTFGGLWSA
ncbi:MAG: hypothetical protein V3U92_19625 [Cellulophaga sp.]